MASGREAGWSLAAPWGEIFRTCVWIFHSAPVYYHTCCQIRRFCILTFQLIIHILYLMSVWLPLPSAFLYLSLSPFPIPPPQSIYFLHFNLRQVCGRSATCHWPSARQVNGYQVPPQNLDKETFLQLPSKNSLFFPGARLSVCISFFLSFRKRRKASGFF